MSVPDPNVIVTVQDQGASAALAVPASKVQVKIGCAIGGTINQPYASSSPTAIQAYLVGGPLLEASGIVCQKGNTVIAIPCPIVTKGAATAVQATVPGGSSSTITTTLDSTNGAWDAYFVVIKCTVGCTIGVAGGFVQVSLDAGRNFGAPIPLGTANTLVLGAPFSPATVGGTGIQINFGAGTLVAGDSWRFMTTAPQWDTAGVNAALAAFAASQYAVAGIGSAHIVGPAAAGDISSFQLTVQGQTGTFLYNRLMVELRDANGGGPGGSTWGGSNETEAAWMTSIETAMSGETAQPRICADGGYYNTPSPYANAAGGAPAYRRPLTWSQAARRTQIGLQRRAGAVADGPYDTIAVNPAVDPTDGFVYHDERITPGLNAARIASARTWPKKGAGFFQHQEPLLSAPGSQFTELVIGNVLDVACDIGYAAGVELVSDDLIDQANGTLDPIEANKLEASIQQALNVGMLQLQTPLVSAVTATVDRSANVQATGNVPVTIAVQPKGYVNTVSETIFLTV